MSQDWSNPETRAAYAMQRGAGAYNQRAAQERAAAILETVNGHALRRVGSAFGPLVAVGDTGKAFAAREIERAREYARSVTP